MDALMALTATGLAITLYLVITTVPVSRRLRYLKREIHKDRVRNSWASARVMTYQLAREGKLAVDSATFTQFVALQTFILRRPDEYGPIAELLLNALARRDGDESAIAWKHEIATWPHEMRYVLQHMSEGTYALLGSRRRGRLVLFLSRHRVHSRISASLAFLSKRLGRMAALSSDQRLVTVARGLERIHVG